MKKSIIIKQAPSNEFRLGLEKQNLNMFENTENTFEIPMDLGGKFLHGLNDEEKKIVEEHYNHQFDNKEHMEFWSNLTFKLLGTLNALEPNHPETILQLGVLNAMKQTAPSLEDASNPMANYKWIVYKEGEEEEMKATYYEKLDDAIVQLSKLRSVKKYLLAIAKYLLPSSAGIGNNTEKAYVKLREFIEGKLTKKKNEPVDKFLSSLNIDKELLYCTIDFRTAFRKNVIRKNSKGYYYNPLSSTEYGKNEDAVVKFLMNPKNQEELGTGGKDDPNYSIRYQLKLKI